MSRKKRNPLIDKHRDHLQRVAELQSRLWKEVEASLRNGDLTDTKLRGAVESSYGVMRGLLEDMGPDPKRRSRFIGDVRELRFLPKAEQQKGFRKFVMGVKRPTERSDS